MTEKILTFEAQSPEELEASISILPQEEKAASRLAALNIYGPGILVSQFSFPRLSQKELRNSLILEAVGMLSLSPAEIELDYQIQSSMSDKVTGIFIAIPKVQLEGYISRLEQAKIIPARITANILSRLNWFLYTNKIKPETYFILDFYKDHVINLAVFNGRQCEFLREIRYDNMMAAEQEIANSLKYVLGKSESKSFNAAYSLGDVSNKDMLIANLQQELNTDINHWELAGMQSDVYLPRLYLNTDLINNYGIPILWRRAVLATANVAIAIGLLACIVMGVQFVAQKTQMRKISGSFNLSDYNRALDLQYQLKRIKNAK